MRIFAIGLVMMATLATVGCGETGTDSNQQTGAVEQTAADKETAAKAAEAIETIDRAEAEADEMEGEMA